VIANALYDCQHFGDAIAIRDPEDFTKDMKLLILHGGEDISPSIYGEVPVYTGAPEKPSPRDEIEMCLVKRAWELGIPVLGICRGAQLVCAMLGGKLYQHVSGHTTGGHRMFIPSEGNRAIVTNSFHHQMMIPKDGEVLAHAGHYSAIRFRESGEEMEAITEPEVVFWEKARTLAVQGHPEWDEHRNTKGIYAYTKAKLFHLFGV
jgi:gamma-glutamyl-gamma-aminobutyrate hydrolase PuuD